MRLNRILATVTAAAAFAGGLAQPVAAATEIQLWHAFTGPPGEILPTQVAGFNTSQSDYQLVAVYKGHYSEQLTAGIEAFRAQQQPPTLQVFEGGTATMMAAKGAAVP